MNSDLKARVSLPNSFFFSTKLTTKVKPMESSKYKCLPDSVRKVWIMPMRLGSLSRESEGAACFLNHGASDFSGQAPSLIAICQQTTVPTWRARELTGIDPPRYKNTASIGCDQCIKKYSIHSRISTRGMETCCVGTAGRVSVFLSLKMSQVDFTTSSCQNYKRIWRGVETDESQCNL
jgi:hypothetical protein